MNHSTAELGTLIDLLRTKGVRSFEDNGLKLELGAALDDGKSTMPAVDPELCRCGHGLHAHTNGLCILGCDASACLDGETEKKLEADT